MLQTDNSESQRIDLIDERRIGTFSGNSGPTIIVLGALHGNEPAGVKAIERILQKLNKGSLTFRGTFHGLRGNLSAVSSNERYIDEDMNRNWYDYFRRLRTAEKLNDFSEDKERHELLNTIVEICSASEEPVIFFDLHSTSAPSIPFAAINDSLYNRNVLKNVPVPIILGLQEQIKGTLNGMLNDLGLPCILFEAGQHEDPETVDLHEAFLWYMLYKLGCLPRNVNKKLKHFHNILKSSSRGYEGYYEVTYRHNIQASDEFKMDEGYESFQPVSKNNTIARDKDGLLKPPKSDLIFMPLYQSKGSDGYFLIRHIRGIWISFSKYLRKQKLDRYLGILPGVKRLGERYDFMINKHIAVLYALPIFHLFGYRKLEMTDDVLYVSRIKYDDHPPHVDEFIGNVKTQKINSLQEEA